MKTLVVPTDFSANAYHALEYALAIARKMPAKIIVFHAYHLPSSNTTLMRDISPMLKQDAERDMARLIKQVKSHLLDDLFSLESVVRKGHLLEQLATLIRNEHVDLVVMGTKGASGLSQVFIGSNTASVIEHVPCPVMAIPESARSNQIQNILYATNYQAADMNSLRKLIQLASLFDASVTIVHIAEENSNRLQEAANMQSLTEEVKKEITYPHLSFQLLEGKDILNTLENVMQAMNIDLVATTTRHRNLYQQVVSHSFTKKMAYHTHIPLLVFHA
ncbi:universal stress protein [Rhodocytophaga aerolata]|uniref:Universal stress protein n=1 Tax=Rhodocytophaga aerolata TaxID=455078 RepID=A0ABT8R2U2_9BACT|nr:universal stress protein [Rhodocytophaga aerolata]MDO1446421.1 universal stress protein [Rhodocytophaga aerolata]